MSLVRKISSLVVLAGLFIGVIVETAAAEPARGGVIRYGHLQEPPCLYGPWIQQWYLERQVADNLVSRKKSGEIVPWLATKWTVSPDHKTYDFELRPNVKFTDGTPLDAKAVVDNFNRWLGGNLEQANFIAIAYLQSSFKAASVTGSLTFRIDLTRPYQPLLDVLSQSAFGILSPTALDRGQKANCEQPIGSGPFIVEKWNHGQNVIFKTNPNYNSPPADAKHQGPPYVDGLVWKFLVEPTVRYGSLQRGESDVIYDIPGVDWAAANKQFQVIRHITGGSPLRFQLNTASAPFDDIRVRKAFAYATERKKVVDVAYLGAVPFEGNGALSASSPEYLASLANSFAFDPAKANALLDEAGWTARNADGVRVKNGRPLTARLVYGAGFLVTHDGVQGLQIIQQEARDVGFDIKLVPVTQAEFWAGKGRGPNDYEIQLTYWTATSAEVLQISWRPETAGHPNPNNLSHFQDPRLWPLIEEADQTFDTSKQINLYQDAQTLLVDSAAVVGFAVLPVTLAVSPKLKDVWLSDAVGEPVFSDAYFEK